MKHGGPIIFIVIVALGLYVGLALRSGSAWLFPTQRMVSRKGQPFAFWSAVGVATAATVAILALFIEYEMNLFA